MVEVSFWTGFFALLIVCVVAGAARDVLIARAQSRRRDPSACPYPGHAPSTPTGPEAAARQVH